MSGVWLTAAGILLFLLFGLSIYSAMELWSGQRRLKRRLSYESPLSARNLLLRHFGRYRGLRSHISELLETLRMNMAPDLFIALSGLLLLAGTGAGSLMFQSAKGAFLFGLLTGLSPYTVLRALLVHRRIGAQMDFLPAVELFYQCYLITGERQVKIALQRTVEEGRLLGPMQAIFEQLYRNLSVRGDDDASLKLLSLSLGHVWGDYFANILKVSLSEGISVSDGLKELITDMRKARRSNEQERHRLLEIRLANFTPVLFLALFVGINFRYNKENAIHYYFSEPQGRDMLLNAFLLIFASFLMGLWLSRKKM